MSQTRALYRLQTLDSEIDLRRSRVRELNAALAQDEALRQAQAQTANLENRLHPQESRAADLNLEIQSIAEQTSQLNDRLYSGEGGSPKELEDIQHKIAERKRRRAHLEDDLLETMIQIEELQESLSQAQHDLRDVEAAWNAEQKTLADEMKRLKHELKTLKAERQEAAGQVTAETLDVYETLRVQKRGQAVAVLENGSCSVCRVGQTENIVKQVRQDQQLVKCTSCGRILVALW
jgi:predicted  nucleic acid-binding Zn-ribbon protein